MKLLTASYVTKGWWHNCSNRSYEQLIPGILWFGGSNLSVSSEAMTEVNLTFGYAKPGTILIPTEFKSKIIKTNLSIVIPAASLGLNYEDDPPSHVFGNLTVHFIPDCKNETTKSFCVTCENFYDLLKMFSATPCEIPTQQSFGFSTRCSILCHQATDDVANQTHEVLAIPKNNPQGICMDVNVHGSPSQNQFCSTCEEVWLQAYKFHLTGMAVYQRLCVMSMHDFSSRCPKFCLAPPTIIIKIDNFTSAPPSNVQTPIGFLPLLSYKDEETKSYHIACSTWLEDYGYEAGLLPWDEEWGFVIL